MISRRTFLQFFGSTMALGIGTAGYAFGYEPLVRLNVTRYQLQPRNWPHDFTLKIAALADLHICKPWLTLDRLAYIVEKTNALNVDLIVLLGDYSAGTRLMTGDIHPYEWAPVLGELKAPLGVHAVLGNHDWWEDKSAQRRGDGPTFGQKFLEKAGVPVYENQAIKLQKNNQHFWLLGLGDQLALRVRGQLNKAQKAKRRGPWIGRDDLAGTIAQITDDAPAILLAHEPDIFVDVPPRIALTLSGHTHGGQVRFGGWSPVVPSRYGNEFAYGHIKRDDRHLIVSGGLGTSILPVRFGIPPEIIQIELGYFDI